MTPLCVIQETTSSSRSTAVGSADSSGTISLKHRASGAYGQTIVTVALSLRILMTTLPKSDHLGLKYQRGPIHVLNANTPPGK
ncbi:hypothetical protein SARC_16666, partial [Sphaeroforma arctica JP610]